MASCGRLENGCQGGRVVGLGACVLAAAVAVACNVVLGNHLDHGDAPAAAEAGAPEAAAPGGVRFCKSLPPDPKRLLCDDFDDEGRISFISPWGSAVTVGGDNRFDTSRAFAAAVVPRPFRGPRRDAVRVRHAHEGARG